MRLYELWYSQGGQRKLKEIEANGSEEANRLTNQFLAEKRVKVSLKEKLRATTGPTKQPKPEFIPAYPAN